MSCCCWPWRSQAARVRPPGRGYTSLGTDGFGRSESRAALRRFFEIDAAHIVIATLGQLAGEGLIDRELVATAMSELGVDPDAPNPVTV